VVPGDLDRSAITALSRGCVRRRLRREPCRGRVRPRVYGENDEVVGVRDDVSTERFSVYHIRPVKLARPATPRRG
jgi:hypothetical protein